jgi:hypothetical protein
MLAVSHAAFSRAFFMVILLTPLRHFCDFFFFLSSRVFFCKLTGWPKHAHIACGNQWVSEGYCCDLSLHFFLSGSCGWEKKKQKRHFTL